MFDGRSTIVYVRVSARKVCVIERHIFSFLFFIPARTNNSRGTKKKKLYIQYKIYIYISVIISEIDLNIRFMLRAHAFERRVCCRRNVNIIYRVLLFSQQKWGNTGSNINILKTARTRLRMTSLKKST